ncbi:MAG: hypothetical protein LBI31_00960 [Zoogloeaceae bacterium]|jgi:hypothetical protein|nr:hypothetical protein [Zoogloeaceae bacterium]
MEAGKMDTQKFEAELEQTRALTSKLQAETMKIQAEAKWYPFVATAALFAAAIGVVKVFM